MLAKPSPRSGTREAAAVALRRTGFYLELDDGADTSVIRLHGELDMAGGAVLQTALGQALATGAPGIVLDLTELTFVDSAGLSLFLDARNQAIAQHKALTLRNPTGAVLKVLRLIGADRLMSIEAA